MTPIAARFPIVIVLAALIAGPGFANGSPQLVPAALSTSDGIHWSGLTLGKTTPNDIKSNYRLSGGDIPVSLQFSLPRESGYRLTALFSGKKDTDPLADIVIRYDEGKDLGAVQQQIGTPGQSYYQSGRLDDWWLQVFPQQGIVAFVFNSLARPRVMMLMIDPPAALDTLTKGMSTDETPIIAQNDPHALEPKRMDYGTVLVESHIPGLDLTNYRKLLLERQLIDADAEGTIRYVSRSGGRYTADMQGSYDPASGGKITVHMHLVGDGPYGPISVEDEATANLEKGISNGQRYNSLTETEYGTVFNNAQKKTEADFAAAIRASGPPSPAQIRQDLWGRLFEVSRQASAAALYSSAPATNP